MRSLQTSSNTEIVVINTPLYALFLDVAGLKTEGACTAEYICILCRFLVWLCGFNHSKCDKKHRCKACHAGVCFFFISLFPKPSCVDFRALPKQNVHVGDEVF